MNQVEICNLALTRVGGTTITSISDTDSANAMKCNVLWEPLRNELLSLHYWSFAMKAVELALTGSDPVLSDYTYEYQAPSDLLTLYKVWENEPYDILEDKIYCNKATDCYAVYTFEVTNPELFPSLFATAMGYRLAMDLAVPVANPKLGLHLRDAMANSFDVAISEAMRIDAQQLNEKLRTISGWIEARDGDTAGIEPAELIP